MTTHSQVQAAIETYAALAPRTPIPARLEAGQTVIRWLHTQATASPADAVPPPWLAADPTCLASIPVVPADNLAPLAWRLVDHHDNTISEGRLPGILNPDRSLNGN